MWCVGGVGVRGESEGWECGVWEGGGKLMDGRGAE